MKILSMPMILMAMVGLVGCAGGGRLDNRNPLFRVDDLGINSPDVSPGGPIVIVWKDGVAAVSTAFPAMSADFRLVHVDLTSLQPSLDCFIDAVPSQISFAADEWKARATIVRDDGHDTTASRDLPMCFVDARCQDRLGSEALAAWKVLVQLLQKSTSRVEDIDKMRRAENLWKRRDS